MIGTSLWDYVFIRSCIFVLHSITPLCILYSLVDLLVHPRRLRGVPWILHVWITLETLFYLLVFLPLEFHLQRAATHPQPLSRESRRELFRRCYESIPDPERYLQRWFMGAQLSDIKRENLKEFLRWAYLNKREVDPADDEELEEYIGGMEKLLGRSIQPGRGSAKCLRLTLEKIDMLHRSLVWYLVSCRM
jgi:hypothetical protein